jgi:hypothetical protein
MRKLLTIPFLSILTIITANAQRPWQKFNDAGLKEIAAHFLNPPPENGLVLWWGWDGPVNEEVIRRDLDKIQSFGFRQVMIEAGYGMAAPYLSPGWFELVKIATEQARLRGMRVWVEDEGKYPSGFAGGKFSSERPDLRMQGLVITEKIDAADGQVVSRKLMPGTLSAVAVCMDNNLIQQLNVGSGELLWTAPSGKWQVLLAGHEFRTSQTRSVNNPTRGKDVSASLFDYLNPEATRQFITWTHEQYKKYVGTEFGKTFMGLMGDEPDFAYTPWTPQLLEQFKRRKGYDIQPFLASFFVKNLPDNVKRAKADYWDVWSSLFSENFFKIQADWCAKNNIEYIVHLNHEEMGPALVKSEGDFFKNMRYVGVPGVDAIWSQIWMDHEADYPKLASSAAHVFGKPRAFTESFAAYTYRPTVTQAKWVIDYQLVRGINLAQIMFMPSSAQKPRQDTTRKTTPEVSPAAAGQRIPSFFTTDSFPPVAHYINRATYLLSVGRPAARIAVYFPTSSMWLGDNESNESNLSVVKKLLEKQQDFDFIDEQALSSILTLEKGTLQNLSGQRYLAVIIPSITAVSKVALEKLKAFSASGGKVVFMGHQPSVVVGKTFLNAAGSENMDWAVNEPSGELSPAVMNALPKADVSFEQPCPDIKYLHRRLNGGELYFFFNESAKQQYGKVALAGVGIPQSWDAASGKIESIAGSSANSGFVSLPLAFKPYETKFIIIKAN